MVNLVVLDHSQTMNRTAGLNVEYLVNRVGFEVSLELQQVAIPHRRRKSTFQIYASEILSFRQNESWQ